MKPPIHPPRWATWLLDRFGHPNTREEVQGDLLELYDHWLRTVGQWRANWRYCLSALKLLRPLAKPKRTSDYPSPFLLTPDMIRNYLKIAWRNLAKNKVYSAINVIGLSIGLAAAMLIILYTKDEVSYDRFHANHPNIYRITYKSFAPTGSLEYMTGMTGYLQGPTFGAAVLEIQSYVRYTQQQRDVKKDAEVSSQEVFSVDPAFFSTFTFPLLSGNPKTALGQPKSVVISEEMALKQFGTISALGKTMLLKADSDDKNGFEPYTVTGVAKTVPRNSSIKFEVLLPLVVKKEEMENSQSWFNTSLNTFVVLHPNADPQAVAATMNRVYQADVGVRDAVRTMAEKYNLKSRWEYALQPFTDMHLSKDLPAENGLVNASNPVFSYILSGIALFILLIACINFVNLTVARSLKRAKEIGVRKVVGGDRTRLILQFLGESFMLCLIAFVFAIGVLALALPTFNQLANKALALSYLMDTKLVAGYGALFVTTGLAAGFYPALVLSKYSPVQTLYSRFNLSGENHLQKSLVVLQFALATFLIITTLTIQSQFNYFITKDLGYNDEQVISVVKPNLSRQEARLFKQELVKNPAVMTVAAKNRGGWNTSAKINGNSELSFAYETVDADYLPLLKIPIVQGRNFSPDFPGDSTHSVLINETFAKQAGWKKPVGQTIHFGSNESDQYSVVGVVKDYHFASLTEAIRPQLFTIKPGNGYGKVFIKIKPNTETASLSYIEKTFKRLFPTNPYSYKFQDQENAKRYESEAKWKQIMLFGAMLTIFISCIGLFGLATLSAERRTKEIGVRKVLGASVSSIVQLLSSDFLKLVSLSFVFAFPIAWYAMRTWLQNYPYKIDIEWWVFAKAGLLAVGIALLTVSFQSIKAALMNPVKSLRSE